MVQPNLAVANMMVTGVQSTVVTRSGAVSNTTSLPSMWTPTLSGTAVANGRTQNWTTTWTVQR